MAEIHKLVWETKLMYDGNVFHDIFKPKPHQLSKKDQVHACHLKHGNWESTTPTVGSTIVWNYTHDGKEECAEEVIEALDEEKKSVTFKVIEGDLMKEYKTFIVNVSVDTKGKENTITWACNYEKLNEDVPEPNFLMEISRNFSEAIESGHVNK